MINDILHHNILPKIGLERVDTEVEELFQVALPPFHGSRITEVNVCATGLPVILLERPTILSLDEIALLVAFGKEAAVLRNPVVDPHADLGCINVCYKWREDYCKGTGVTHFDALLVDSVEELSGFRKI